MSIEHNLKDDFKLVSYKNTTKKQKNQTSLRLHGANEAGAFDSEVTKRRILEAKADLKVSDLYSSILASLREGLACVGDREIKEIVCFGLGRFGECVASRYQLALLLCLKDLYQTKVCVHDPVFSGDETDLLKDLGLEVSIENIEGKYKVPAGNLSLFYLPHCPKQLTNNLLWRNWGLGLSDCVIVSNSFTAISERNAKKSLQINANYICNIIPYTLELPVFNSFKFFDIFNDTAIHVFPPDKLALISEDFWTFSEEPKYKATDLEFIAGKLETSPASS